MQPVVILGAGLSGLALSYRLERRGIRPTLLDGAPRIGDSWRRRHPQLKLNTHRHFSSLPGSALPRAAGTFASRDAVVSYLEDYSTRLGAAIELGVHAERIERGDHGWRLLTTSGERRARHVVVATGRERVPVLPSWPGRERFEGRLVHAADLGDVRDYEGASLLVVGAGNSGVDALNHLVRVPTREIWLSARTGANIVPTRLLGVAVHRFSGLTGLLPTPAADRVFGVTGYAAFGNLRRFGLRPFPVGAVTRLRREGISPAVDDGFVDGLRRGVVAVVPAVAKLEPREVILVDGRRLRPDVVICATGYSPALEPLVGHLDVLDAKGIPRRPGARPNPGHPGLWFLGMKPRLTGTFDAVRHESRALAGRVAQALGRQRSLG